MSGQGVSSTTTATTFTPSGVRAVVASTAADLLPGFLEWIADAPSDPFEPQVVVVPNVGMAEYLEAAVRAAHGVCANVEFLFPGRLRERSGVAPVWPWSVEDTTWMVLAALDDPALAEACGLTARLDERPIAVARHVAELFDRYHSYRPGLIEAWRRGEFVDDLGGVTLDERFRWQYELLRAVDAANEPPEVGPRTLPDRVAVFGAGAPVGAQAALVDALVADGVEVTAYLLVPGRLPDALERWAAPAVAALEHFAGGSVTRPGIEPALPEIELHRCYGPGREFDAARDAILERFVADRDLTARDVTVVAPAIARTAPLAAPILGAPLEGDAPESPRRLPVRIADRVPSLTPSVAVAIDGVLGLAAGRCRATEVLAVLRLEPVAAAFGLSPDAAERVSAWILDGLDVRWGLDAEHRGRWGYDPALTVGAWAPAIDRLLAGLLIQNPGGTAWTFDEATDVLVPFDDIAGSEFGLVGTVAEFVHALRGLSARIEHNPTLGEWADVLEEVLATFVADSPTTRGEINATREVIGRLRERAATIARPVSISEFRGLVGTAFDERTGSARNRFDAVTIGGPRARRGVPHRLTAIVGLDDDATRAAAVSGDDLLVATGSDRPWEADRSAEARLAILDALLGTERAIVTTTAHDIVTNRDLGLPVVVEELADALPDLRAALGGTAAPSATVVAHHRRLADDPTFDPAGPGWARALDDGATAPTFVIDAPAERGTLGLRDLTAPYRQPHDLFLREGLDAALPPSVDERDEEVDLAIGRLQEAILTNRLVAHLADGRGFDDWIIATRAGDSLPPMLLGDTALDGLVHDVAELLDLALGNPRWPEDADPASLPMRRAAVEQAYRIEPVRVLRDLPVGDGSVRIDDELAVVGDALVVVHHGELQGRHLIEPWIALALLTLERPGTAWSARLAGYRSATRKGQQILEPTVRTLRLLGDDTTSAHDSALAVLTHVLRLRALARSMPVAVFPRATTELALGEVGAKGASGWKFPAEVPAALGSAFGEFQAPLTYDLQRGATAWCFGDTTGDELELVRPTEREVAVLGGEATTDSCAALAYARHLHLAFAATATIAASIGGAA